MGSIKIKDFFNGRFFVIPKYQRGYAWEKQNIRDLFDDVQEAIQSNSNHYIGTLVLSKDETDDEKFYVVDGQQRITTITLMMSVIIKQLEEKNSFYYERFYIQEDGRYRLKPLSRDGEFFSNLLSGKIGIPQNKSQRFLKEAIEEIEFKISAISDKLKFLKSLEKLEIMEFAENSEGDAIRIFQTVNDRGKLLSNMEKAKSLLIYFSNRYLSKKLDTVINDYFSDIFEIYDDIKHVGEELDITLIRNKNFNEDNLMRYHFVTFSEENYDPTESYVLQYLKNTLIRLRNEAVDNDYSDIDTFISSYIESLKEFFDSCKKVVEKAKEKEQYYKILVVLSLSATLYPLIIQLESMGILDKPLPSEDKSEYTFLDLVELIEVRVYKIRGTDPKADISRFVHNIRNHETTQIEGWLRWFNSYWMSKELFQSNLSGGIYGNRALNHIFITYSENLEGRIFTMEELKEFMSKVLTIEHILSQTPNFTPQALGFNSNEDFIDSEHRIGNLTLLEKSLNSSIQNKSAIDKVDAYSSSSFKITRKIGSEIESSKGFVKTQLQKRTEELVDYCIKTWWC